MPAKKHMILRFVHVDNLEGIIQRGGMCAPNHTPNNGIQYKTIHSFQVQNNRSNYTVRVGPKGVLHDYVPFYFAPHSPMMLQLKTGQVAGYDEGQEPLIYLVSYAEDIQAAGCEFAFTDGHGIAAFTEFFDDLADLAKIDWKTVRLRYWADTPDDNDRKRRKQAEFLVHRFVPWEVMHGIAVINEPMKTRVESIVGNHAAAHRPVVRVMRNWYY